MFAQRIHVIVRTLFWQQFVFGASLPSYSYTSFQMTKTTLSMSCLDSMFYLHTRQRFYGNLCFLLQQTGFKFSRFSTFFFKKARFKVIEFVLKKKWLKSQNFVLFRIFCFRRVKNRMYSVRHKDFNLMTLYLKFVLFALLLQNFILQ